jgi:hypothetical protein
MQHQDNGITNTLGLIVAILGLIIAAVCRSLGPLKRADCRRLPRGRSYISCKSIDEYATAGDSRVAKSIV